MPFSGFASLLVERLERPFLKNWSDNGNPRTIDFPITPDDPKRFYRMKVAFE